MKRFVGEGLACKQDGILPPCAHEGFFSSLRYTHFNFEMYVFKVNQRYAQCLSARRRIPAPGDPQNDQSR